MLRIIRLRAASSGRRALLEQKHREASKMRHLQMRGDDLDSVVLDNPEYQHGACSQTPQVPREIRGHGFKQ